jgi:hypothetical protein
MAPSLWSYRGLAAVSPAMINSIPHGQFVRDRREAAFVAVQPSDASMFVKRPPGLPMSER